ncbi:MAG: flippase-like domain-containing protein [Lentisphaeraceae bacterium]|nr:flippase-like domain-containing protein [Lentisphaeraceae bacterium]
MKANSKKLRNILLNIISFAIVLTLIYFTAAGQFKNIAASIKSIKVPLFILAAIVYSFALFITFYRWFFLLKMQNIALSFSESLILHMSGFFFNTTTPGAVSGDVVKMATVMKRDPDNRIPAIMTIFMDRLIGLFALIILTLILVIPSYDFIFTEGSRELKLAVAIVAIASICGILFIGGWLIRERICALPIISKIIRWLENKSPKIFIAFQQVFDTVDTYKKHWKKCLYLLSISIVSHTFLGLSFYIVGLSLGISANPLLFILSIQISNALSSVLPLPGGLGIRDAVGKSFLVALKCTETQAASTPLMYTAIILFWAVIGSFFFLYWRTIYKSNN